MSWHIGVGFGPPLCGLPEMDDDGHFNEAWHGTTTAGAFDMLRAEEPERDYCLVCLDIYERDNLICTPPVVIHEFTIEDDQS